MVDSQVLAQIHILRVIFHDVPTNREGKPPVFSETESELDPVRIERLKRGLTKVLGLKSSYDIVFDEGTLSPVPGIVKSFTDDRESADIVSMSVEMAKHLFLHQVRNISPGLFSFIDATVAGKPAVILMKLEPERGAQLDQTERDGKRTYKMSILDGLVLTDGTRVFKAAIFVRKNRSEFIMAACNPQSGTYGDSDDLTTFWLRFLGCRLALLPRVQTAKVFHGTMSFLTDAVSDPILKSSLYEALASEMRAKPKNFSPRGFMEVHMPASLHNAYKSYFKENSLPWGSFPKDLSLIDKELRRRSYRGEGGAIISVPEDKVEQMISVQPTKVVVNDVVRGVGRKQ